MPLARDEYGIAVSSAPDSWKVVQRAEELGFTSAWFSDSPQLNSDVFVSMSLAAAATRRIRLGTGVLVPGSRTSAVTASALASLNALAPGRIDFGVGTGFTARRAQGLEPVALNRMLRYADEVQTLLRGEAIGLQTAGGTRAVALLSQGADLLNTGDQVRLHVSAMGPRGRRQTAEREAGWLTYGGTTEMAVAGLTDMQMSWGNCGNPRGLLHSTVFNSGRILERGEAVTSELALAQAGPFAASFLHDMVETSEPGELDGFVPPSISEALERYRAHWQAYGPVESRHLANHAGHLLFLKPEERALMSAELIQMMTLTGAMSDLRQRVDNLQRAGFSQIVVQLVRGHEGEIERWAELFDLK